MTQTVRVKGLRELLAVTDQLPKDVRKGVRKELRRVAEPVRDEANSRFLADVSPVRSQTRYGISVRKVGTISVEQRAKAKTGNPLLKRGSFTDLQWSKALGPAVDSHADDMVRAMDDVLQTIQRKWAVG